MGPAVLLAEGSGSDPAGAAAVQTAEPAGHQRDGHGPAAVPPSAAPPLGLGCGKRGRAGLSDPVCWLIWQSGALTLPGVKGLFSLRARVVGVVVKMIF